jgi:hypothetical protein
MIIDWTDVDGASTIKTFSGASSGVTTMHGPIDIRRFKR